MNAPTDKTPPLPDTFDLEELKGVFSDEEIKALAEGDDPIVKIPEVDPNAPKDATLADEDAAAMAAAQQAQHQAQQPEPEQKQAEPPVEIPDTTEADAVLKAFDAKMDAIQDKYDDGELSKAEMNAAVRQLVEEQATAKATINRATEIIQSEHQKAEQQWLGALETFKAAGNEELWSPDHVKGFDAELRHVTANAANMGLTSFEAMIRAAARRYASTYEERSGQTLTLGATKPAGQQQPAKLQARTDPRPDAPTTLAGLNGDGGMAVDDGSFAAIDRAASSDPFEAERMLARLTPEARDLYLKSA